VNRPSLQSVVSSPWMILVALIIGWGPQFIADVVRVLRPDLDAKYVPEVISVSWLGMTILFSAVAVVLAIMHGIFLIFRLFRRDAERKG